MSDNNDQYNRGGMIAFLLSMAFVLCFFLYVAFIHPGVDLKENLQIAEKMNQSLASFDPNKVTEPWVENKEMAEYGKKVFAQNCTACHGNEGKGDGPAGQALNPKPRNLVEGPWKKGGGYTGTYTAITEGIAGSSMASYAHLKSVDRWALVQFINSITKAKVNEDAKKISDFAKSAK